MNEEDKRKEEQRLADKKFEDFIQGLTILTRSLLMRMIKKRDNVKCSEI
ncbi:hypothetical protein [Lactiplantibacillus pentosus]